MTKRAVLWIWWKSWDAPVVTQFISDDGVGGTSQTDKMKSVVDWLKDGWRVVDGKPTETGKAILTVEK